MTQDNVEHGAAPVDSTAKNFPSSPRMNARRSAATASESSGGTVASSSNSSAASGHSTSTDHTSSESAASAKKPRDFPHFFPNHLGGHHDYQLSKLRVANREVFALTRRQSKWQDFYHASMTSPWWQFIAWSAAAFLLVNVIFALLYAVHLDSVGNVPPGKPWFVFFFSVETFATVGYGNMYPKALYAHVIATMESYTGLLYSAVITGLAFARFARPRARIIFAKQAVIGRHEGQMMWMTRVANERHNHINGAEAKLWLVRTAVNEEGQTFRRYTELALRHKSNPMFVLNWTIMHPITRNSPLYGMTAEDWAQEDFLFVLVLEGTDETIGQNINARHTYHHKEVRWYEQFADMIETTRDGKNIINFQRIHDTHEQPYDPKYDAGRSDGQQKGDR